MNNEQNELAQVVAASERAGEPPSDSVGERPYVPNAFIGFKAPTPWDGWSEEERRAAFGGFLYPAWHPFAVCEGQYMPSMFAADLHFRTSKVRGEVDESIEERKKQFAVPMVSKSSYGRHSPVGTLKRPT